MAARDPKRMAAAVLALNPSADRGDADEPEEASDETTTSGEVDTEEAALEAASEELIAAMESKDPRAVMSALRSAFRSMRK